jgi:hypothetical protein
MRGIEREQCRRQRSGALKYAIIMSHAERVGRLHSTRARKPTTIEAYCVLERECGLPIYLFGAQSLDLKIALLRLIHCGTEGEAQIEGACVSVNGNVAKSGSIVLHHFRNGIKTCN